MPAARCHAPPRRRLRAALACRPPRGPSPPTLSEIAGATQATSHAQRARPSCNHPTWGYGRKGCSWAVHGGCHWQPADALVCEAGAPSNVKQDELGGETPSCSTSKTTSPSLLAFPSTRSADALVLRCCFGPCQPHSSMPHGPIWNRCRGHRTPKLHRMIGGMWVDVEHAATPCHTTTTARMAAGFVLCAPCAGPV